MKVILATLVILLAGPASADQAWQLGVQGKECWTGNRWIIGSYAADSLAECMPGTERDIPAPGAPQVIDVQGIGQSSPPKDPLCLPGWTAVQVGTSLATDIRSVAWKCAPAGSLRDPE